VRELPADLLTPVGAFLRLRHRGPAFLLESVERGQQVGRYSFLRRGLQADGARRVSRGGPVRARCARRSPSMTGADREGAAPVHRAVRSATSRTTRSAASSRPSTLPDRQEGDPAASARFLIADIVVVFDHVRRTIEVIAQPGRDRDADAIAAELIGPLPDGVGPVPGLSGSPGAEAEVTPDEYEAYVRRAQEHIEAGDAFPDRDLAAPRAPDGGDAVRDLPRAAAPSNPSPYMVFADFGSLQIISASPETHVALTRRGVATLKPIAGSRARGQRRRRGRRPRCRAALGREGARRAPDARRPSRATTLAGGVCEPGTVEVVKELEVERYSHIMHSRLAGRGPLARGGGRLLAARGDVSRPGP